MIKDNNITEGVMARYRRYPGYHQSLGMLYEHAYNIGDFAISSYDECILLTNNIYYYKQQFWFFILVIKHYHILILTSNHVLI